MATVIGFETARLIVDAEDRLRLRTSRRNCKSTGVPYPAGDLWILSTELQMANGQTEPQTVMIKFYEFNGVTKDFSIGSKEKGVVD